MLTALFDAAVALAAAGTVTVMKPTGVVVAVVCASRDVLRVAPRARIPTARG
jgi:hypothetical protein